LAGCWFRLLAGVVTRLERVLDSMRLGRGDDVLWYRLALSLRGPSRRSGDGTARGAPSWSADSSWAAGRIRGRAIDRIACTRRRRSSALAGDDARLPRRSSAAHKSLRYHAEGGATPLALARARQHRSLRPLEARGARFIGGLCGQPEQCCRLSAQAPPRVGEQSPRGRQRRVCRRLISTVPAPRRRDPPGSEVARSHRSPRATPPRPRLTRAS
jgi:hypothetical protein